MLRRNRTNNIQSNSVIRSFMGHSISCIVVTVKIYLVRLGPKWKKNSFVHYYDLFITTIIFLVRNNLGQKYQKDDEFYYVQKFVCPHTPLRSNSTFFVLKSTFIFFSSNFKFSAKNFCSFYAEVLFKVTFVYIISSSSSPSSSESSTNEV